MIWLDGCQWDHIWRHEISTPYPPFTSKFMHMHIPYQHYSTTILHHIRIKINPKWAKQQSTHWPQKLENRVGKNTLHSFLEPKWKHLLCGESDILRWAQNSKDKRKDAMERDPSIAKYNMVKRQIRKRETKLWSY